MSTTNSTNNNPPKISLLEFPQDFQVTPDWVERTDNLDLLKLSLNSLENNKNNLMKSLIQSKIQILTTKAQDTSYITLGGTEKDTGNQLMKSKNFPEAIMHYTYSVIYNSKESATYCNRALAFINQSNYQRAISDCTTAILLNPNYVKAYYRRATCFAKQKKYQLALEDLLYLVNTGNNTKEIDAEIEHTIQQFKADVGEANWDKLKDSINSQVSDAKSHSLDPNSFSWNLSKGKLDAYETWEKTSNKVKGDFDSMIKEKNYEKAESLVQTCFAQCEKFKESYNEKTSQYLNIYKSMFELNTMRILVDFKLAQKQKEIAEKKKQISKTNIAHDRFFKTTILSKDQRDKATKIAEEDIKFSDYANSAYGFERAFSSFKTRLDIFYEFLKYFGGKKITEIYANSEIPIAVLNGIIQSLQLKFNEIDKEDNCELYFDYLNSITKSKSFGLVKNFIKKKDKAELEKMINKIAELNNNKKEDCDNLLKLYK